jgi:hypothetical protein
MAGRAAVPAHEDRVRGVHHDLPDVSLRVAFARLAAVFARGRASYVAARRRHPHSPASRWLSAVPRRCDRQRRDRSNTQLVSLVETRVPTGTMTRDAGQPPELMRGCGSGDRSRRSILSGGRSTGAAPDARTVPPAVRSRGRPRKAGDDEYVGLVADDVDHIRGELVKLRATINCHVPSARRGLVLVAVSGLALSTIGLSAKATAR